MKIKKVDHKQETIIVLAGELLGKPLSVIFTAVNELFRLAKKIQQYNENNCNRETTDREDKTDCKNRLRVYEICEKLGIPVETNGDPRGCAIKLTLPSGKSNCFFEKVWGIAG